jgi:hypothetical protein
MSGYESFAPVYDAWATDMVDDVDFDVDLAREAEGPVIELAAGSGRAGLETEALYDWFDRRTFDDDSREFVWIARKPS